MKTEDLIGLLATGAGPAPSLRTRRSLAPVLISGLFVSIVVSLWVRGLVPVGMWSGSALWTKLAYAGALAAACVWLVSRLSRPGSPSATAGAGVTVVVVAMAVAALIAFSGVAPGDRSRFLLGETALICPWAILVLALPTLGALLWVMRDFAPTRPALTGFAAGLLAGAVGAAGYGLSCAEESTGFIAVWYSLGIALSGGAGALAGARLLRW